MSCLIAAVSRIGEELNVKALRIGEGLAASVESGEHLSAFATATCKRMAASAQELGERLQARCSIICSVGGEPVYYVRVSPDEVQWITDDMGVFFDVESNTEWIVENL